MCLWRELSEGNTVRSHCELSDVEDPASEHIAVGFLAAIGNNIDQKNEEKKKKT